MTFLREPVNSVNEKLEESKEVSQKGLSMETLENLEERASFLTTKAVISFKETGKINFFSLNSFLIIGTKRRTRRCANILCNS
jgi:hypothetical protein